MGDIFYMQLPPKYSIKVVRCALKHRISMAKAQRVIAFKGSIPKIVKNATDKYRGIK